MANPYFIRRKTGLSLVVVVVIAAMALLALLMGREPDPGRPMSGQTSSVATTGQQDVHGGDDQVVETPDARGGSGLIGRELTVRARASNVATDIAFWSEEGGRRILVVPNRDRRTDAQRQQGIPAMNGITGRVGSGMVLITGRVEPLPHPEAMYSWNLTAGDRNSLKSEQVYLRGETVRPAD